MMTAEARVQTGRPARYLAQLCQHLSNRGRHLGTGKGRQLRHRTGNQRGDHPQPDTAGQVHVEWSETEGTITLPGGQCVMRASGDALLLRAEAVDAATLDFIENLIASHLGRFSRREPLAVTWQRSGAPTAQPPPSASLRSGGPAE